ncbi:MAG TPA: zinc-binding dehydrogenase [Candidatus Limnocylindria bacterium]
MPTGVWFPAARSVELRSERPVMPGPHDVRVHAIASGVSHGTEMLVYRGQVPEDLALDLPTLAGSYSFPIKFGYASVGRVVAVGDAVTRVVPGQLVFVHHPHQDEYVVPEAALVALDGVRDAEQGIFLANTETAVNVVLDAHPHLGDVVAVHGQGVVGLLVTQLLRRSGARVVAVDPIPLRRDLAMRCGADVSVAPDGAADAIRERTGGRGADLAIEVSGSGAALQQAIDSVAFQGTVVVASWYGTKPVTLRLGAGFHRARVRLASSQVGTIDPALAPRWDRDRRLALARELLGELVLAPLVTHRIPFARAADAYALVDAHADETVQVLLTYD